jgi:hypothetical protein
LIRMHVVSKILISRMEVVVCIEWDRLLGEGKRELIKIFEEKIKKVIEMVWES